MPTNNEVAAASAAVRKMVDAKLPGYESMMVTDDVIRTMVTEALGAAENVRNSAAKT
jgi:hypothetical protein